jgi:glycosyltransferase involved in cell wall biosynthesis
MNVLNVVSVFAAREGGGNAERTVSLTRALLECGERCTVLTLDIGNLDARAARIVGATLVRIPCLNRRFQVPWPRWCQIRRLVAESDVIHLMGYWSLLGVLVYLAARWQGVPYVVSPAGALPLFGRSLWFKRLFNRLVGRRMIQEAQGWLAITRAELTDFCAYGVPGERVVVLPNGVVESDYALEDKQCFADEKGLPDKPYILFMGRLNPIKGPDLLLGAFARVAREHPDHLLVYAGPDEGMKSRLAHDAQESGLHDRVLFVGFVGGSAKVAAFRSARLLVVPSRLEAMSIVAVEAGICGTPVLMTDQCGLDELGEVDANLLTLATEEGLAAGLRYALADSERLRGIGQRWQELVRSRFLWSDIGLRLRNYLKQVVAQGRG